MLVSGCGMVGVGVVSVRRWECEGEVWIEKSGLFESSESVRDRTEEPVRKLSELFVQTQILTVTTRIGHTQTCGISSTTTLTRK